MADAAFAKGASAYLEKGADLSAIIDTLADACSSGPAESA